MRQNGRTSIWVVAAVESATGWSLAMPFHDVNTATMRAFLDTAAATPAAGLLRRNRRC